MTVTRKVAPRPLPTSPFTRTAPRELPRFSVGDRLTHDSYGLGRVLVVHDASFITIDFGGNVIRRLPVSSRGLVKI